MAENIKYQINVETIDNPVASPDNKGQKIFHIIHSNTLTTNDIVDRIMYVNPGLERETVQMSINLYHRIVNDALVQGMRVTTETYSALLRCKGSVKDNGWSPGHNQLYAQFTQSKQLREAIADSTSVHVIGEKGRSTFLASGIDTLTQVEGSTATAGEYYTLRGQRIKIAGTDPSVGITLTSEEGHTTRIPSGKILINRPREITFRIPLLPEGEYILTLTTQYTTRGLLKTPCQVTLPLYIQHIEETEETNRL